MTAALRDSTYEWDVLGIRESRNLPQPTLLSAPSITSFKRRENS